MNECAENRQTIARQLRGIVPLLNAVSDENRQTILLTLLESEEAAMRVEEITSHTELSRPAVSYHLKVLREAGLVDMYSRGTMNFYYLAANTELWEGLESLSSNVLRIIGKAKESGYPGNMKGKDE